jgi:hypothetical protein
MEEFDERRVRDRREKDMERIRRIGMQKRQQASTSSSSTTRDTTSNINLPPIRRIPGMNKLPESTSRQPRPIHKQESSSSIQNKNRSRSMGSTSTSKRISRRAQPPSVTKTQEELDFEIAMQLQRELDNISDPMTTTNSNTRNNSSSSYPPPVNILSTFQLMQQLSTGTRTTTRTTQDIEDVQMAFAITLSLRDKSDPLTHIVQEPDMSYESLLELEDVKVGLTEKQMKQCTTVIHHPYASHDTNCSICLCELSSSEEATIRRIENCGHEYHEQCLFQWLKDHKKCPLCNEDL